MARKRLIWHLFPSYLLITLVALVAVTWYSSYSLGHFYLNQTRDELSRLADVAAGQILDALKTSEPGQLDSVCKKLGRAGDGRTRVTVILPSGKVLGDSDEDPAFMEDHSNRREIIDALKEGFGWSVRSSPTLGIRMMYVAKPIKQQGESVAVVRTAIPANTIDQARRDIRTKILWAGLAIAICAAGLSLAISRRISRPIVRMEEVAQHFAEGRLDLRVPIPATIELGALAKALNEMARQLHNRILMITNQRNELETILSSMVEGVVAVDGQGHIVSVNKAAADLLSIEASQVQGRNVEEVIRNVDFQQFVKKALESEKLTEAEISLPAEGGRFFRLHGASLADTKGGRSGAVIVLNDMTQVRRLENIRRDFVANVSHELKTPVTSIHGFVEALLDPDVHREPQQANRYLQIIAKHSDRLNAIIEDLLSLSRLEEDEERRKVSFETVALRPVLESAIELSNPKAAEKQMTINLDCDDQIKATINAALLEQAVVNLIDNAVKYSQPGGHVRISVRRTPMDIGDQIALAVEDDGCGIEKRHLSRIFERFYVVDKGRSRRLGGTGLGLAIVKHIARVHGGSVTVESTPGMGSTFTIHLPAD
jgi:two-component system phosphate regulon sensor histidine kinase PhoR